MEVLFWLLVVAAAYSYFIYPALLSLLPARPPFDPRGDEFAEPCLTLVIPAFNEGGRIADKIENTLTIDYPAEKLQIIVASDASTDSTDKVIKSYAAQGVIHVRASAHRGKEYVQALALNKATGDIVVFSDSATIIPADSLRKLVQEFRDPDIGAVSSQDVILDRDGNRTGESSYVRYEMWLRRLESSRNSLIGLSGSFFATRRELCEDWDHQVPGDFTVAMRCAQRGLRAISSEQVVGHYQEVADDAHEYQRKLRTVIHGFAAVAARVEVLNPLRYGLFALQTWSHKIMRWLVPWLALPVFMLNIALVYKGGIYEALFFIQLAFGLLALCGFLSRRLRQRLPVKIPYYFIQVNLALMHAAILFLEGERMVTWEPSVRGVEEAMDEI